MREQRPIRFRAWDGRKLSKGTGLKELIKSYMITGAEPLGFEFMQYTGLKDKNGVEIYEGDIVRYDGGVQEPTVEQVVWFPEQVAFTTISKNMVTIDGEKMVATGVSFPMRGDILEVIGNIYENPDLLGDTTNE